MKIRKSQLIATIAIVEDATGDSQAMYDYDVLSDLEMTSNEMEAFMKENKVLIDKVKERIFETISELAEKLSKHY